MLERQIRDTIKKRLEETVKTHMNEKMDKLEFNNKMEQAITDNQRISVYLNMQINHMVAKEIQTNLGNKMKEHSSE